MVATTSIQESIRVVVADDHSLLRFAVEQALSGEDITLVKGVATGEEAVSATHELEPTVLLLDLHMPGKVSGLEVVRLVAGEQWHTRVIVFSADIEPSSIYSAIQAGATGYLGKDVSPRELRTAVRAAHRGNFVLSPALQGVVASEIRRRGELAATLLTPRERRVLQLVAEGQTTAEIARTVIVSRATIKADLGAVYLKLSSADRASAVATALRRGIIQ